MKKTLLLTLFALHIFNDADAQRYEYGEPVPVKETKKVHKSGNAEIGKLRFGVFLAPNFSWMKPTANKSDDKQYLVTSDGSKTGFMWGLMMDYYFADNYAIATGFQINYTGGKITSTINPAVTPISAVNIVKAASIDYKIQYLEVPFGLKLRSDDLNGVRVFGQLGINLGVPLSKKASYTITYSDTVSGVPKDISISGENEKLRGTGISPVLLQMNIGGGMEYAITEKMSIYAGIFYNNGFIPDVTQPKDLDLGFKGNFSDGNIRLNNIAIRIGMFF